MWCALGLAGPRAGKGARAIRCFQSLRSMRSCPGHAFIVVNDGEGVQSVQRPVERVLHLAYGRARGDVALVAMAVIGMLVANLALGEILLTGDSSL